MNGCQVCRIAWRRSSDRQELAGRPQAVVITHAPSYLPQAHGAQGAASMLHTYAAAAPGTRTSFRSTSNSAICMPLVAAPLRRLSATTQSARPLRRDSSRRMRPTKHLILAVGSQRCGIAVGGRIVDHGHARRRRQQLARASSGESGSAGLDPDRLGVAAPDRHAHAGGRNPQIGSSSGSCASRAPAWSPPRCCRPRRRRRSAAAR